jgi:hypothetical protein
MGESRQSVASTDTTAYSSLFEVRRRKTSNNGKYGTIRTMTTEATSEGIPSFTRTEGSSIAASLVSTSETGVKLSRDRRTSETPVVDLSRVAEEPDESGSSAKGGHQSKTEQDNTRAKPNPAPGEGRSEKAPALRLGKGKWPDDFIDAIQARSQATQSRASVSAAPSKAEAEPRSSPTPTPISVSPPRKLAIVGATRRNDSLESIPQFPRRPAHRARHSIDTLLPKDPSPEGVGRVVLRRHSTKPGGTQRHGVYFEERDGSLVPFPSGATSPSPVSSDGRGSEGVAEEKPRVPRGRFQSDIEGGAGSRRQGQGQKLSSHDEVRKGVRPRIGSMANLGGASSNASASDLLTRESEDGSAVRKTLIVREEGKPPTHFVSMF